MSTESLFRCEQFLQSTGYDYELDQSTGCAVSVSIHSYEVIKETEKGHWVRFCHGVKRWVSKTGKKRFAYPTKEAAIESFKKRKLRQIAILSQQLEHARQALAIEPEQYTDCTKNLI